MTRPLAIDLCCGLTGWGEGLISQGFDVVGYDIEDMFAALGEKKPDHFELVLKDVLTLHGSAFKDAAVIVASPPCQEYSYIAMPWSRGKQIGRALRGEDEFPAGYTGSRTLADMTAIFDACFRIQREASEAAGRHIPLVVENVRGAEPWVGKARWNFGSYYLWGDVPALMPHRIGGLKVPSVSGYRTAPGNGARFTSREGKFEARKHGGDWFSDPSSPSRQGGQSRKKLAVDDGRKGSEGYERDHPDAFGWKKLGTSSHSKARKAASAKIAKIPFALSSWIAKTYKPSPRKEAA